MPDSPRESRPRYRVPEAAVSRLPAGSVRVATTMAIPAVLIEHGVDPGPVFAEFGLDRSTYEDPDNTIPFATSCAILQRCAELARCPHFGLLVGQRAGLSMLGPLGYLMQSAPDVRTALIAASVGFRAHNNASVVNFSEDVGTARFGYWILSPDLPGRQQLIAGAIAVAFNSLRTLCGPAWRPYELRLAQVAPEDLSPFRRFFQCPIVFDAAESSVVFASRWLDRRPPGADPVLNRIMRQRIGEARMGPGEDLVAWLDRNLPSMVLAGDVALESVALRVGLGVRSLDRRLAAHGTSLRQMIQQVRYSLGSQLLQDTQLAVTEISDRLGYADVSAFTRAFKRWTGQGPTEWRESKRVEQAPGATPSRSLHPAPGTD